MRWILNITNSQVFAQRNNKKNGKRYSHIISNPGDYIICGNHSEGNHIHYSRHTETCDNITSKGMVGRSGNVKATSTEILLECQGFTNKKVHLFRRCPICRAVFAGVATVLFTMGYCYRLSPKQSHTRVILHAAVSHQIKSFLQRCVCYLSGIQPH